MAYRKVKEICKHVLLILCVAWMLSCSSNVENKEDVYIFSRRNLDDLRKAGLTNIEISKKQYFFNQNIFYNKGLDNLVVKSLTGDEFDRLLDLLAVLDYTKPKQDFIGNKSGAYYSYDITIKYKQKEIEIEIFDDSIPKKYEPLISFIESITKVESFDTVYSKLEGVNYSRVVFNPDGSDSSIPSYRELFSLWKYLMMYKGKVEEVTFIDSTKNHENYSFMYGTDYPERKINRLLVNDNDIHLFYDDGKIFKIDKGKLFEE